ncbi:DNA-binding protein [Gordonia sp. CPCC 205333]|uniref:DNA-binding protein n=1 Tax=Gordonia sp. CPCC 205333 TaxID=3140790 RepID=UPI003AF404E5
MSDTIDLQEAKAAPSPVGTAAEVAAFMHTTPAALAQDRYLGRGIPYVKHGRKVLYKWSDVQSYLDSNTVNPGAA